MSQPIRFCCGSVNNLLLGVLCTERTWVVIRNNGKDIKTTSVNSPPHIVNKLTVKTSRYNRITD